MTTSLTYFFAYLKTMNLRKLSNVFLVHFAHFLSKILGTPITWGMPYTVSIETVAGCNLSCPGCEQGSGMITSRKGLMSTEDYFMAINKLPSSIIHVNLHFQGEPLLHPKIAKFIRMAGQKKIKTSFSTNAMLLDKQTAKDIVNAGLTHILISLDGDDNLSYQLYRKGGDFHTVTENIKTISLIKKELKKKLPLIEVQAVVMKSNEHKLQNIKKIAMELGANRFSVKTAYLPEPGKTADYLPKSEKYRRYKLLDGLTIAKKKPPKHCFRIKKSCVILCNLDVVPCCFDKNGNTVLGNLHNHNLSSIVKNQVSKTLLKNMAKNKQPHMCKNCI
jgi:MoaA/NifB/PqqE/SkfB family radical SAM enzyme